MAFERHWKAVPPQPFTADGTQYGLITVADSCKFRVKQVAYLVNTAGTTLSIQVKKVINPTQLIVGPVDNQIAKWNPPDLSSWTVASGAKIGAEEQLKNRIGPDDHYLAVYEGDPVVADRIIPVDCNGDFYDENNPFPVSATFSGDIDIEDPDTPLIMNINVINPLLEQTIVLPAGTKRYLIKSRDYVAKLRLAYNPGETANNYLSIARTLSFSDGNISIVTPLNLYVLANIASTIEVHLWIDT